MNWYNKNKKTIEIGFLGESKIRDILKSKKMKFMQVDVMFKNHKNKWCLGEVKTQERFLAPPFDGHGLPEWQIKTRIEFYNETGIEPYLFIYELNTENIYYNSLLELTKKESFKTNGKSPRTIFNLNNFKQIKHE